MVIKAQTNSLEVTVRIGDNPEALQTFWAGLRLETGEALDHLARTGESVSPITRTTKRKPPKGPSS